MVNGNNYTDPNLTALVPTAVYDVCILEFDFVPLCDSLKMNFVFGSEEYPQGVPLAYNDAFAIFLSGPNPAGGTYVSQNIANLPNGTAVSIHNVNAGANAAYFHNNYSSPNADVAYNGYTIPITSVTSVAPCSTYHIKFAIADAGNAQYDSGVFISNNTLSCQAQPVLTTNSTPTSGCSSSGTASVTVSNYTGTVSYHWLPGGQTTAGINHLPTGTYTCNVSTHTPCGTLTQSVSVSVATSASNIVLTVSQQSLTCMGGSNASATVTAVGGAAPYSYLWNTTPAQTSNIATNLSAGTYIVTVSDNTACQATLQINITNPPPIQVSVSTTSTTCTGSVGTASVTISNHGVAPYNYVWDTNPVQYTAIASNLPKGTYTVLITDAHNCTVTATASIPVQAISWGLSVSNMSPVSCYGGNNGAIAVSISNPGTNTFSYAWDTNPLQTTSNASGLPAGSYSCTVTDNNGCVSGTSANITQPAQLTALATSLPTLCSGAVGSATVQASGGTGPYHYSWNSSPSQSGAVALNLAQGSYTAWVTDAHQCQTSVSVSVSVSYPALQIQLGKTNAVCGGPSGSLRVLSVTPAAPPYLYTWSPGGQNTASISNLFPGNYSLAVTDANGCLGNTSASVGTNTFFPIQLSILPDYCGKSIGSATANPQANPPYQYQWSTNPPQYTQSVSGLSSGNYTVIVTDGYNPNCKDSVVVNIGLLPPLALQMNTSPTFCHKNYGSASVLANGFPPYQYIWNGFSSQNLNTATQNNLVQGLYTVLVSDAYQCVATASCTVMNQNDVFAPVWNTNPSGDLYSQTPIQLSLSTNSGWTLTNGYLSDGTALTGLTVTHTFEQSGNYTAYYTFTSTHGCIDSVSYELHIIDYATLYIPNSFSPNKDGKNDFFKAEGSFIVSFEMYIYDRWGNLIEKLTELSSSWNGCEKGKDAPEDLYLYTGTASDINGNQLKFNGQINLIR